MVITVRADRKERLKDPVVYFSKHQNHTHSLHSIRQIIVDGRVVRTPGMRVNFKNGRAEVYDPDVVAEMDKCLEQPKWAGIMFRAPGKQEIARAAEVGKKIEEARKKIIADSGPPKAAPAAGGETFKKFLEKQKAASKPNVVKGARSIANFGAQPT
jgi:hypothetical protein